ncbi:polysaccharide lyase, partial [Pseudoxanthomonas sp. SGD-10]
MNKFFCTIFSFLLVAEVSAQYPVIPKDLQAKSDSLMDIEKAKSEKAWEKALIKVKEEEKQGRPYIPWAAVPTDLPQAKIPAFPGAEGGGAYSFGGRGGKVYVVTNLNDSGEGSLRWACEQGGARIVVFNVAGIIHLKSPIVVKAPYITIAGQTAPGDGVCVAGESFLIDTHDVVVRFMRFRRGSVDVTRRDDALGGNGIGNIILDHVSASWGLDENMSMYRHVYDRDGKNLKLPTVNITIQNSIFSEALDTYNHAFGSTIGGLNSTFMRNLWASNISRNPSVGMYGDFGFVNNVVWNWWN